MLTYRVKTLQSMFNKLQKSLAPSKTLDPLSYLPIELAEMIAQQLSIRERMYVGKAFFINNC